MPWLPMQAFRILPVLCIFDCKGRKGKAAVGFHVCPHCKVLCFVIVFPLAYIFCFFILLSKISRQHCQRLQDAVVTDWAAVVNNTGRY